MTEGRLAILDQRALSIVEGCLELDEAARKRFVDEHCASDPELRCKVDRMLQLDEAGFRLLATEASGDAPGWIEEIPERIGPFRITATIGRGGMGTVVRAERDDGLYAQTVAIKLIRAGMNDSRARERFAQERQILARLSHPAIARILDGGSYEGRPYLIMDYVEGRPVTVNLALRNAPVNRILDAFEAICDAVSHAHRNLVVHADIKPSNVIMTTEGTIKLVDFGISRLIVDLDRDELEGPYPITRNYAAPERIAGRPPTVAGDVFSLGALFHEMLTGALPASDGQSMSLAASGDDRVPTRSLAGDLDAIVSKTISPNPDDRYPDVAALIEDILRHREKRPVRARRQSIAYRTGRFLSRNRLAIGMGSLIFVLLSGATIISLNLYFDARDQRAAAEARFQEVRSLAKFQLFDLYDSLAEVPGTTAARAALAVEGQRYLGRLATLPQAGPALRIEVAAGLNRLASIQGVPRFPNLGRPSDARTNLGRAAVLLSVLNRELPNNPEVALESARNLIHRAQIATWLDFRTDRARALLTEAERRLRGARSLGIRHRDLDALRRSAELDLLGWEERHGDAKAAADAMLAWLDRWPPNDRALPHLLATTDALNARGDALYYLGERGRALADYAGADSLLVAAERRHPRNSAILARLMLSGYNVVTTLDGLGRDAEMPPLALALVERGERTLGLEANDETLRRRHFVNRELAAQTLAAVGRYQEAIAQQRPLVEEREALLRREPLEPQSIRDLAFSRSVLGTLYWYRRLRREACGEWMAAEAMLAPLERSGRLNQYDRTRNLAYIRYNLEICRGTRPLSAFRPPD